MRPPSLSGGLAALVAGPLGPVGRPCAAAGPASSEADAAAAPVSAPTAAAAVASSSRRRPARRLRVARARRAPDGARRPWSCDRRGSRSSGGLLAACAGRARVGPVRRGVHDPVGRLHHWVGQGGGRRVGRAGYGARARGGPTASTRRRPAPAGAWAMRVAGEWTGTRRRGCDRLGCDRLGRGGSTGGVDDAVRRRRRGGCRRGDQDGECWAQLRCQGEVVVRRVVADPPNVGTTATGPCALPGASCCAAGSASASAGSGSGLLDTSAPSARGRRDRGRLRGG